MKNYIKLVVCKRSNVPLLVHGKIYPVLEEGRMFYLVRTDPENTHYFNPNYFGDATEEEIEQYNELNSGVSDFKKITGNIAELLEYKNSKYGNSALNPLAIFNGKSKVGQRIDDKLARIKNAKELSKNDVCDLIGYLILVCVDNNWKTFNEFKD
jgi:hypothetical protein